MKCYLASLVLLGATVLALGGCTSGGQDKAAPAAARASDERALPRRGEVAGVTLVAVPDSVIDACAAAQERVSYVVLCPPRLPRGTEARQPWRLPEPLQASTSRDAAFVAGYGADDPDSLAGNHPRRNLHLIVTKATLGLPQGAKSATIGGKKGWYAPAAREYFEGFYFGNHARFAWRERGTLYVASLHGFGAVPTRRLLGAIVGELRPARELLASRDRPRDEDAVDVGIGPTNLAATDSTVWAISRAGLNGGGRARLHRIDRASRRAELVWDGEAGSPRLAGHGDRLWTATPIVERDEATGRVIGRRHVGSGRLVTALAAYEGGALAAMVRWRPGQNEASEVWSIAGGRGKKVRWRARVGRGASDVAIHGESAWVVSASSGTVSRLRVEDGKTQRTLQVGGQPFAVAATSSAVWVSDPIRGLVLRIDPMRNEVVARVRVGNSPRGVVATADAVWVAVMGEGRVVEIDPRSNAVVRNLSVGGDPIAVAQGGGAIWVALYGEGIVKPIPSS